MEAHHRCVSRSPDIDQGWAFVVMLCGCMTNILTLGLTYTTAIFYITFLEEFGQSPSFTAWTVSLTTFMVLFTGEVANAMIRLTSLRVTIVIGCAISTAGLLACSFAPTLTWILVMYGVVAGVGFSLSYFPYFSAIANCFSRYRVLAFAVCSTGVGVGQFVYAPLLHVLIDEYHWRGAFLILAGINLNHLVAAAAMMPPRVPESCDIEEKEEQVMSAQSSVKGASTALQRLKEQLRSIRLFRRPRWVLFCFSMTATSIGITGFLTHISKFAEMLGHSKLQAAFLPSAVGIAGLCSRIAVGALAQHPRVHVFGLYMFFFTSVGVVNIVSSFVKSYPALVVCSSLCGISMASYAVYAEAVIHIVGTSNLVAGVSYSSITNAIGILLGGPIAAWVYEVDPTYHWSFITVGLVSLLGGLLNLPSVIACYGGMDRQKKQEEIDLVDERHCRL